MVEIFSEIEEGIVNFFHLFRQEIGSGFHLGLPQKEDDLHFNVLATANGSMRLAFPHLFKSMCKLNMSEYPFDLQRCPMVFGSWSHNQSEVDINIKGNALASENQYKQTNKAWQMTGSGCTKYSEACSFDSSKRLCPVASCYVALKRKAWFEVISYTLPTIIIAALSIMVFMVPPEAGKRMGEFLFLFYLIVYSYFIYTGLG